MRGATVSARHSLYFVFPESGNVGQTEVAKPRMLWLWLLEGAWFISDSVSWSCGIPCVAQKRGWLKETNKKTCLIFALSSVPQRHSLEWGWHNRVRFFYSLYLSILVSLFEKNCVTSQSIQPSVHCSSIFDMSHTKTCSDLLAVSSFFSTVHSVLYEVTLPFVHFS